MFSNERGVGATSLFAVRQRTAKSSQMAKSFFAVCRFFAVCFWVADGKELLCRQLADGKELADGKLADSSSMRKIFVTTISLSCFLSH